MPAVLSRNEQWSLWASQDGKWALIDRSTDREDLARKAASLIKVFTTRKFAITLGNLPPVQ